MKLSKFILFPVITLLFLNVAFAQDSLQTVTAKSGDGIFSILRNEGIDVVKYYEEFLELNQDNIKNGSHLIIGQDYIIPNAPDSFKNRGVKIQIPEGKETPIFDQELASLKVKDSTLKNTVYYLIDRNENVPGEHSIKSKNDIAIRLARKLIQSSARVYVVKSKTADSLNLLDFVSVVNKKYLKHNGDYQRLLIFNSASLESKLRTNVTVYHYAESEGGKKFADNILKVLGKGTIKHKSLNEYSEVFTEFGNIAFAKNILPVVTFIDFDSTGSSGKKTLKVTTNKKSIADLITSGILSDYSNTEFEDN